MGDQPADTATVPARRRPGRHRAVVVAVIGLLLWAGSIIATWTTQDTLLIPTVIFIGSFLSPIVFATWLADREQFTGTSPDGRASALTIQLLLGAFFFGGLAALAVSAVVETFLLSSTSALWTPGIAVAEETAKLATVWVLALRLPYYLRRDGMVLGASVGFGFAAYESAGYAFDVLLEGLSRREDLIQVINTEVTRALLSPVGHGLWTALTGGALFAAAAGAVRLRLTPSVVGWWLAAVSLHILWDWSGAIAVALTDLTTGSPIDRADVRAGRLPNPTVHEQALYSAYSWMVLGVCAVIGIILARWMWRKGRARQPTGPIQLALPGL